MIIDAHVHLPVAKGCISLEQKKECLLREMVMNQVDYCIVISDSDEKLKVVYELAIQYNVPVLFHSGWDNCKYADVSLVAEVARSYPDLKVVCCPLFIFS